MYLTRAVQLPADRTLSQKPTLQVTRRKKEASVYDFRIFLQHSIFLRDTWVLVWPSLANDARTCDMVRMNQRELALRTSYGVRWYRDIVELASTSSRQDGLLKMSSVSTTKYCLHWSLQPSLHSWLHDSRTWYDLKQSNSKKSEHIILTVPQWENTVTSVAHQTEFISAHKNVKK